MKTFNGKAIYQPNGKAAEYSKWACNFYVGCSNECTYCYLKKGIGAKVLGGNVPKLKACFKDENHALEIFEKELKVNLPELQKHGLFFSFTTDPCIKETYILNWKAIKKAASKNVNIKILTKKIEYFDDFIYNLGGAGIREYIAAGFTLTGHDELEQNASTNAERIEAMRKLHEAGFKTWASIEPVIDFESSLKMIYSTSDCCDLYKIGLMSGAKYDADDLWRFVNETENIRENQNGVLASGNEIKIYFKDSLLRQVGRSRSDLPSNCIDRDYNMFNN